MKKNIYGVKALCRNMKGVRGREEGKGGGRGGGSEGIGHGQMSKVAPNKKEKKETSVNTFLH